MKMPNMCPFEKIENLLNNFRKKKNSKKIQNFFFWLTSLKKLNKSCSLDEIVLEKKQSKKTSFLFFSKGHIVGIFILVS